MCEIIILARGGLYALKYMGARKRVFLNRKFLRIHTQTLIETLFMEKDPMLSLKNTDGPSVAPYSLDLTHVHPTCTDL